MDKLDVKGWRAVIIPLIKRRSKNLDQNQLMSTAEMEISFWRADVGDTKTAGKQHEQSRHPALAPRTSYLAGHYFPEVAPVRSSTVAVKPVELIPWGESKKLLACTTSGAWPGDALAWAAHVLPASRQHSCSPDLSCQASCFSNCLLLPWPVWL